MSPKVPKAYLEARRAEILGAAYKCFMEKGFHNTTMQDIYDSTNLSPGAVYNYFSSKEDIVVASVQQYTEESLGSLDAMIEENPDESFIKYFRFIFSTKADNDIPESFNVDLEFFAEATRNSSIREAMIKAMDATGVKLIDPIRRKQQAGLYNARLNPVSIAHVMVGMVFAAAVHKMLEPDFDMANYRRVCEAMLKGTFSTSAKRTTKKKTE
jgi:AcrR family transcriptional regulator